jgi:prophage maintenance system killer protein
MRYLSLREILVLQDILTKAAALCFFLVMNHPFVDGNKRVVMQQWRPF